MDRFVRQCLDSVEPTWVQLDENGKQTAYSSDASKVMVLSTECDCEQRTKDAQTYIRLCPVLDASDIYDKDQLSPEKISTIKGNLKANNYTEYFWMPSPKRGAVDLVADISHVFSVCLEDLHTMARNGNINRIASLSEDAYFLLLIKLAWFFLRPPSPDTKRIGLRKWDSM